MRVLYVLVLTLALPVALPIVLVVALFSRRWRSGLGERLTLTLPGADEHDHVWLHAASLGEMTLALELARRLEARGAGMLITTNTAAGFDRAAVEGRRVRFAPLDHPITVARFFAAAAPRALVVLETELWPNWLHAARRAAIPSVLVNGRISARAARRYRLARSLLAPTLAAFDRLLMRSEQDAERARALGAPAARVLVVGDLKAGATTTLSDPAALRRRYGFTDDDLVLVAGSTDEGEEALVVELWRDLRRELPRLKLVVAPRQPGRFGQAWATMSSVEGAARASADPRQPSIVLLDTVGQLRDHYALADLAFVGGSFTDRGGQNILEPALLGCPVCYGPRVPNWEESATILESAGGGFRCATPPDLAGLVRRLMRDPAARAAAGAAARGAAAQVGSDEAWSRTIAAIASIAGIPGAEP